MHTNGSRVDALKQAWKSPRWHGIERPYAADDVIRVSGTLHNTYTIAEKGADKLWALLHRPSGEPVRALGAVTGNQAVQMVRAGLEAIYVSGWQVAADNNDIAETYPDQSLYPAHSVPLLVERINNALGRHDLNDQQQGTNGIDWFVPLVADGEAGFGGPLNAFELMRYMIKAGAAGVHFEDQYSPAKKCGHLGGKVLVPTRYFMKTLAAARLAADVMGVPTILIARTDAHSSTLLMNDVDEYDHTFVIPGKRTDEGFYRVRAGLEAAMARAIAYAPYADVLWCETSTPDLGEAREFAAEVHRRFHDKRLAYNCSPSFNWKNHLNDDEIAAFQERLGEMGYAFQFITLAGFHSLNHGMFELARGYRERGMSAYVQLQQAEFASAERGYTAVRHQQEVGTGYFDEIAKIVSGGATETAALAGSTERQQFHPPVTSITPAVSTAPRQTG